MVRVAGIISSQAQNVYSVNVVGYINKTLTTEFSLVGAQLDDGAGNLATNLLDGVPNLTVVYKFNGAGYDSITWLAALNRWNPASFTDMTMLPGEGVFIKKPGTAPEINLTFVGEVMQGTLVNPVVQGFDMYSTMVPQAGGITTVHEYAPSNLDVIYQWNGSTYTSKTWLDVLGRWNPAGEPEVEVGEAFFIKASAAQDWTRDFTVE